MQNADKHDNEFLMTTETARELKVAPQTVIQWERSGKLPAVKTTNGRRLFRRSDVERVKREREARREVRR